MSDQGYGDSVKMTRKAIEILRGHLWGRGFTTSGRVLLVYGTLLICKRCGLQFRVSKVGRDKHCSIITDGGIWWLPINNLGVEIAEQYGCRYRVMERALR